MMLQKAASPKLKQVFVALGPILVTVCLGMVEGYSGVLLPELEKDEDFQIDQSTSSWIASLAALPMGPGCFIGGYLMEKIGRKTIHQLTCLILIGGWIIIAFSYNVTMILVGRIFTGVCMGLLGPPTGVYISETSEPKLRGVLLAAISFAIAAGIFAAHIIGTYATWRNTALYSTVFPISCLVVMFFAPESPTFLAAKGQFDKAQEAFFWCRGHTPLSIEECRILIERQKDLSNQKFNLKEKWDSLKRPEFYKPLLIIIVFFVTQQLTGHNAITFYSLEIIKQIIGQASMNEYLIMIIMDLIRVFISVLTCIVMKKINRRPHTMISGFGSALSLLALSASIFINRNYNLPESLSILSLVSLVSFMVLVTIGFVPLPWSLMGEVFPLANRGLGSGISSFSNYIFIFIVVKTTPLLFNNLGPDGAFLIYSICTVIGTIILAKYLPETKDKPLYVIEDHFKSNVK